MHLLYIMTGDHTVTAYRFDHHRAHILLTHLPVLPAMRLILPAYSHLQVCGLLAIAVRSILAWFRGLI